MFDSIGCDVEVFGFDPKIKKHKSLCGLIGGTKEKPKQLTGLPKGFCVQEDNVSLEWNIPPSSSLNEWKSYVTTIMQKSRDILKNQNLIMSNKSSVSFDKNELLHPNALVFGCEPDYDAWKKLENSKPICDNPALRTAGGHIHVGTDLNMLDGIKAMDLYLGVPSVLLDDSPEATERRKLYGKAGAMRPKPYGFEYRVLSNFWVFKEELIEWVYKSTKEAINTHPKFSIAMSKKIQDCINKGDKDAAKSIIEHYGLTLPVIS